jgi:ribulose-phosphate 3-epimerase
MIEEPARYVEVFADAGADIIGIHIEADRHAHRTLSYIRQLGKKSSLALNPQTPITAIEHVLEHTDQILIMSVNPGFGGQNFIEAAVPKISALRTMIEAKGLSIDIEVDGGIGPETAQKVVSAGANVLVAGAAIFGHPDRADRIRQIRKAGSAS